MMNSKVLKSLKFKLLILIASVFSGLLMVVGINNAIAYHELKGNIYEVTLTNLSTLQNRLDDLFLLAENHLINFTLDNSDIFIIERGDMSESDWFSAKYRLSKSFNTTTTTYNLDGSFLYSMPHQTFITSNSNTLNTTVTANINKQIKAYLDASKEGMTLNNTGWFLLPQSKTPVMIRLLKINHSYIGSWVTLDNLLAPLVGKKTTHLFLSDKSGQLLTHDPTFSKGHIEHKVESLQPTTITFNHTTYMLVETPLETAPFYLVTFIPESQYNLDMRNYLPVLVLAILMVILLLVAILWMINHLVIQPLDLLHKGIILLGQGHLDQRLPLQMPSSEFEEINRTFNEMILEINTLRINVYEEQLAKQEVQLDYLSLQIAPHFLINAISLSYQLAQMGHHKLTKEMLHDLSIHLRYTLSRRTIVSLRDELEHVRNYIDLSLIRYPAAIQVYEDIEDKSLDSGVIPLILQSFVENTIKYEVTAATLTRLNLSSRLIEGRDQTYLSLSLWDTGRGFPPDLLKRLQNLDQYIFDKSASHYGIRNVVQRTWMVYGRDNCSIHFSNRPKAGAQIDLVVPYIKYSEKGISHDESIDC